MELPYQDDRFSMFVILPVTRNTLSQVEDNLDLDALNGHLNNLRSVRVELHLPRFKSESKFSLKVSWAFEIEISTTGYSKFTLKVSWTFEIGISTTG